jgi:anti-sigma factor RsiW
VTEPHVETALAPYLRGDLPADERRHVERHLADCESCHAAAEDFRLIRERLATTAPPVAEPHWGRYRAELRARLAGSARRRRAWWLRPVPVAMAATAMAAIVLTFTVAQRGGLNGDVTSDDAVLATRLDMIDKQPIVERLDLLEDLDVIRDLDRLASPRES